MSSIENPCSCLCQKRKQPVQQPKAEQQPDVPVTCTYTILRPLAEGAADAGPPEKRPRRIARTTVPSREPMAMNNWLSENAWLNVSVFISSAISNRFSMAEGFWRGRRARRGGGNDARARFFGAVLEPNLEIGNRMWIKNCESSNSTETIPVTSISLRLYRRHDRAEVDRSATTGGPSLPVYAAGADGLLLKLRRTVGRRCKASSNEQRDLSFWRSVSCWSECRIHRAWIQVGMRFYMRGRRILDRAV